MINYVTTRHGASIRLDEPSVKNVTIRMIGTTLAKICRYNGACEGFYSVARHSRLGALAVQRHEGNAAAKAFLLHDAHEFMIGDISTPVVREIGSEMIGHIKDRIDDAIRDKWGVEFRKYADLIKAYDHAMLYHEWRNMMPGEPEDVGIECPEVRLPSDIVACLRRQQMFSMSDADRFVDLCGFWGME